MACGLEGLLQGERSGRRPEPPPCTTPSFRLKEGVVFWGYSGGAAGGEGLLFFAGSSLNKRV